MMLLDSAQALEGRTKAAARKAAQVMLAGLPKSAWLPPFV